jgi:hypothetical protein
LHLECLLGFAPGPGQPGEMFRMTLGEQKGHHDRACIHRLDLMYNHTIPATLLYKGVYGIANVTPMPNKLF